MATKKRRDLLQSFVDADRDPFRLGLGPDVNREVDADTKPRVATSDYAIDTALKYGDANTANSVNAGPEPYMNRLAPSRIKPKRKRNAFFGEL